MPIASSAPATEHRMLANDFAFMAFPTTNSDLMESLVRIRVGCKGIGRRFFRRARMALDFGYTDPSSFGRACPATGSGRAIPAF